MPRSALGFIRRPIYLAITIAMTGNSIAYAPPRTGMGVGMVMAGLLNMRGGGFPRPAASVRILTGAH